jgi:hypothetical protein
MELNQVSMISGSSKENAMRNLSITTIIVLMIWIVSCAHKDAGRNVFSNDRTNVAGASSRTDKGAGENIASMEGNLIMGDYFLPLPSTYLSEIDNPSMHQLQFRVGIADKTPPPPQPAMRWGIQYDNENQELYCWGMRFDTHPYQHFSGVLDPGYKDEFIELVQYIQSYPEFFSYDEYQEAPPGEINKAEQYSISIGVVVAGYDYVPNEHANTYVIGKYIQGMPSEVMQHVVDVMRTVFLPEVLNHPCVVPEVRYDPPLNPE